MLKMIIGMNINKIKQEKQYCEDEIYRKIRMVFNGIGLYCMDEINGFLVCRDTGDERDYGRFGWVVNFLKKQVWFMDNAVVWILCDSDDSDDPEEFDEEDLLLRYRRKQIVGA